MKIKREKCELNYQSLATSKLIKRNYIIKKVWFGGQVNPYIVSTNEILDQPMATSCLG